MQSRTGSAKTERADTIIQQKTLDSFKAYSNQTHLNRRQFSEKHNELLNKSVIIYTGLFIIYRFFNVLTPVHELFEQPGWSMTPKLIGLAGAALLAADLISERVVLKTAHVKWILLLLLTLAVSSAVRYQYLSAFEALKYMAYASVQTLLVYSAGLRMDREEQKRFLRVLHSLISVILIPSLCYMLWQFYTQQHYLNNDFVDQGWHDGRLYGIMHILYDGALAVSLLAFITAYLLICSRGRLLRGMYAAELTICIIYIALSGCRTAYAACAGGLGMVFLYRFCRAYHADRNKLRSLAAKWLLIYTAALIIMLAGISGIRNAGAFIIWNAETYAEAQKKLERHQQYTVSSGRTTIWKTYIEIMTDRPSYLIFGLSYNGYARYIREHYPDTFIITYFKEHYPDSYRKGNVYDAHNSYLFTMVAAGIFGFMSLLIFIALSAFDVLKYLFSGQMTDFECLLTAMIVMLLTAALFETNVFIPVSVPAGCFWMTAGLLLGSKDREELKNA